VLVSQASLPCCDPIRRIEAAKACNGVAALTTTCMNSGTPAYVPFARRVGSDLADWKKPGDSHRSGGTASWTISKKWSSCTRESAPFTTAAKNRLLSSTARFTRIFPATPKIPLQQGCQAAVQRDGQHLRGHLALGRNPCLKPLPGTANGTVVWDTTAHYPAGLEDPVRLTIRTVGHRFLRRLEPTSSKRICKNRRRRLIFGGRRDWGTRTK